VSRSVVNEEYEKVFRSLYQSNDRANVGKGPEPIWKDRRPEDFEALGKAMFIWLYVMVSKVS
jgi:hypothetical protein